MEGLFVSAYLLAVVFFLVAFAYSSVGLGGGSSYTALMIIVGMSSLSIPFISLTLNLFVSSIGSFNFIKQKHARFDILLPFVITSIPMAYLGGALQLPKDVFYWILFISLLFVLLRIYGLKNTSLNLNLTKTSKLILSLGAGLIFGFIAGTVGIGGGIYLVPLIVILGLGSHKEAAAIGIIFVWLNSLSGLLSRLQYNSIDLMPYIPLIVAVILGGALGSHMGSRQLSAKIMENILGVIILVALIFLAKNLFAAYF